MITIRINGKTGEQTVISADDVLPPGNGMDALATILAEWIYEKRETTGSFEKPQIDPGGGQIPTDP